MPLTKFISRIDLSESRVDRDNNVIKGVSLVSLGEARGHNKIADQHTLQQVLDCAKEYKNGLRVRFNPTTFNHGDAGLAGFIPPTTLAIKDGQVTGDMHVYASYPNKEYLYEIAERAPDNFGLSIEFNGVAENIGGIEFARCDEIFAATIVDLPAANPTGLFAAKDEGDLTKGNQSNKSLANQNQNTGDDNMTDEQVKTLGENITTGLVKGLTPVFEQFRTKEVTKVVAPTAEEEKESGCVDTDTPEQKTAKVNEFRANADRPVTQRMLSKTMMEVFRFTGGNAAKSNVADGDEGKNKKGDETFESLVTEFRQKNPDASEAYSITEVRKKNGKAYNDFCARGRPAIPPVVAK